MKLTDKSLMPYGIHKDDSMENVPADYLIYLYENNKCSPEVHQYITDNLDFLKLEAGE